MTPPSNDRLPSQPALSRKAQARRQAEIAGVVVGGLAVLVGIVVVTSGIGGDGPSTAGPNGVRAFAVGSRGHVAGPVAYPQTPPVGGDHAPVWQNCGFYPNTVSPSRGVHSLEHGAVWITYRPGLATNQIESLRRLATGQSHILVSTWDADLASPVVASAWGRQIGLTSASDPALEEFVLAFRSGPQTPEPGAPCSGGQGTPE